MKNTFGTSVAVTLFGESHGEYIGATIDGLAPGIEIDHDYIAHMLTLRRPSGKISTPRQEHLCRNGNPVPARGLAEGAIYRIYSGNGEFLCISRFEQGQLISVKTFFGK